MTQIQKGLCFKLKANDYVFLQFINFTCQEFESNLSKYI